MFSLTRRSVPSIKFIFNLCAIACFISPATPMEQNNFITSVSYLLEAFSPYSTLRFFEFSDKGWNISENCLSDMYSYAEGLKSGAVWAIMLYDATGYYGGGFFGASTVRIPSADLCRHLAQQKKHKLLKQLQRTYPYQLWANATVVPFTVQVVMGHYLLETIDASGIEKRTTIQQQICFPKSCDDGDLQQILEMYLFQSNHVVTNNTYIRHRIVKDDYKILEDIDFVILITIPCVSLILYALLYALKIYIGFFLSKKTQISDTSKDEILKEQPLTTIAELKTSIELNINKLLTEKCAFDNNKNNNNTTRNVNFILKPNFKDPLTDIRPKIVERSHLQKLEAFLETSSLHNVLYNLLEEEATTPQTGFIVFSTIFYIFAHLIVEVSFMSNNLEFARAQQENFILKYFSYIVDIYFFVSGSKMAYTFLETFPCAKLNVFDQVLHIVKLIMQKIFCVTPSYTFSLYAAHIVDKHFHGNNALEIPSFDYRNCKYNKISNIFYLDTFFPVTERVGFMLNPLENLPINAPYLWNTLLQCMPWTWFMSLDVQFFIVGCLVLLLAQIYTRYAIIIGIFIFAMSTLAGAVWEINAYKQRGYDLSMAEDIRQFNLISDNICLRIAPFILGICLGSILFKANCNMALNLFVLITGWLACLTILGFFFFGFETIFLRVDLTLRALLLIFTHIMWSMILLWIVLTGITQYDFLNYIFCFKYSHAFEKISPICLLTAPIIIRLYVFTADAPIYAGTGQILSMGIGCFLTTYSLALLMFVLFDGPLNAVLEAVIFNRIK